MKIEKLKSVFLAIILGITLLTACSYDQEKAIENGDVINAHGHIYNFDVFETFIDNVSKQNSDKIRITEYTIEGDPIFYDLDYDGTSISFQIDNSKDKFRGNGPSKIRANCNSIDADESGVYYTLNNCDENSPFENFRILTVVEKADDVREVIWNQLSSEDKERIAGSWEEAEVSTITLKEHMMDFTEDTLTYTGKEVYLINFPTSDKNVSPNNIIVYADIETFDYIGHGFID
jgi:hypothetical protein